MKVEKMFAGLRNTEFEESHRSEKGKEIIYQNYFHEILLTKQVENIDNWKLKVP
jgi:hypothetical protein